MFKLLLLSIFLLFPDVSDGQADRYKLYIALKQGVTLFSTPDSKGDPIDTLRFNNYVLLQDRGKLDTMESRIDYWWHVVTKNEKDGHVFGGFLNNRKLEKDRFDSISDVVQHLIQYYPSHYKITSSDTSAIDRSFIQLTFSGSDRHWSSTESWQGGVSMHQFHDMHINELLNFISLIDLGGEGYEYSLMMNSAQSDNGYRFEWENEFDNSVKKVELESGFPSGVVISIKGK